MPPTKKTKKRRAPSGVRLHDKKIEKFEMAVETAQDELRNRYGWKKVEQPSRWDPEPGEEIIGYYGGRTLKNGGFGQYEVVMLHVPFRGALTLTGTILIQLLDAAAVKVGMPVRVVFNGAFHRQNGEGFYKKYELYTTDGAPLHEADLPRVEN